MRLSKYRAVVTHVDGIRFHSRKEAARYQDLRLLERAGAIKGLQLQPSFPLLINGVAVGRYDADFRYVDCVNGEVVTEDVKGIRTPVYRLKKRLVEALYPTVIREV